MTKRTRAATAPALPIDPTRRTLLAGASVAAALITSTGGALPAAEPDVALMAVRSRWLAAKVAMAARESAGCPVREAALATLPPVTIASTPSEILEAATARSRIVSRLEREGHKVLWNEDDPQWELAFEAECQALRDLAVTPARTMAGLAFKTEVAREDGLMSPDLIASIMMDVAAFATAHPTLRI